MPFREFESYMGFSSFRNILEGQINTWMAGGGVGAYPEDSYWVDEEEVQTLLSPRGYVTIYEATINLLNTPEIGGPNCFEFDRDSDWEWYIPGNYQYKIEKRILHGNNKVKAKQISFQILPDGSMGRWAVKMKTKATCNSWNFQCIASGSMDSGFTSTKTAYRRKAKEVGTTYTKMGHVTGYFVTSGYSTSLTNN